MIRGHWTVLPDVAPFCGSNPVLLGHHLMAQATIAAVAACLCLLQQMSAEQKRYETVRHALFFKEEKCKQLYKDHVDAMLSRVNSYNGRTYKNDPTILSWNLINEPRCETWMPENSNCPADVQTWFRVSLAERVVPAAGHQNLHLPA
jgi:hypothetical protein